MGTRDRSFILPPKGQHRPGSVRPSLTLSDENNIVLFALYSRPCPSKMTWEPVTVTVNHFIVRVWGESVCVSLTAEGQVVEVGQVNPPPPHNTTHHQQAFISFILQFSEEVEGQL